MDIIKLLFTLALFKKVNTYISKEVTYAFQLKVPQVAELSETN